MADPNAAYPPPQNPDYPQPPPPTAYPSDPAPPTAYPGNPAPPTAYPGDPAQAPPPQVGYPPQQPGYPAQQAPPPYPPQQQGYPPASYPQPPPPQQQQQTNTTVVVQQQPTAIPTPVFRDHPVVVVDSNGQQVQTVLRYRVGTMTWLICCLICWVTGGCWLIALIPCCINSCKDVEHITPTDGRVVGVYRRM